MIYEPIPDETVHLIQRNIRMMGWDAHKSFEYYKILRDTGRIVVPHVLRTLENPFEDYTNWPLVYEGCMKVLVWFAEHDEMSMDELRRYRQILTSEKKHAS